MFLISLKAGGVGLNLTMADYVVITDPWWNPAVEEQAVDRTHRIGQTRAVHVYRLVAQNTIEEKVLALQDSKRQLIAGVLASDDAAGGAAGSGVSAGAADPPGACGWGRRLSVEDLQNAAQLMGIKGTTEICGGGSEVSANNGAHLAPTYNILLFRSLADRGLV